jgi:hypothetical protein
MPKSRPQKFGTRVLLQPLTLLPGTCTLHLFSFHKAIKISKAVGKFHLKFKLPLLRIIVATKILRNKNIDDKYSASNKLFLKRFS